MAWIYVLMAGVLEVIWASALKQSDGFRNPGSSGVAIVFSLLSFYFLSLAMRTLPMGSCYAVWTGIGALGIAFIGILVYGEAASLSRMLCIALIVSGVIGLRISS